MESHKTHLGFWFLISNMFDKEALRRELELVLDFSKFEELWVVGSLADENSTVTKDSDIDLICKSKLVDGVDGELTGPDCEAAQILTSPEDTWGAVAEGVTLNCKVPVYLDNGQKLELQPHLLLQPLGYNVDIISGGSVQLV